MKGAPIAALAVLLLPTAALAADPIPDPVNARVVSVYDGDTLTVDTMPWPGVTIRTSVRVDGINTPEIRGKCQAERERAIEARNFVKRAVGDQVRLADVRHGKYAERVVARVVLGDGQDLATQVIAAGLGRAYSGGKREGWCP